MTDELTQVAADSARGSFFLISGTAAATIILAIAAILVGRFLGPELYGQYTLALVVPQLLFLFTDLGITQGITKFTASFRTSRETSRIARIIKYGLILRAATGIAIFVITYAFADPFAAFFLQRPDLAFYIRITSIAVLFQVVFTTVQSAFIGLDKTEYSALTTNVQAVAKTLISITLVLLGFGVAGAIIGHVVGYAVAAAAGMVLLFLLIREAHDSSPDDRLTQDLKTLIHYGTPLYLSVLLAGFIPLYNSAILAFFTTDADIGNYKASTNFIALMAVLAVPITTALLPAFSKLTASTHHQVKAFYQLANKYTTIIIIPITFLFLIFAHEIVEIVYGQTFQSAPLFLTIHSLLYLLVGLGYLVLPSLFNGLGETKTTLKMSLLTVVILVVLSPIFTQAYGVQGLIAALLLATTAGTTYGFAMARKHFHIEFDTHALPKVYLNSALSSILPLLILHFLHLPQLVTVTLGGLLYLFTYTTLVPLTNTIAPSELDTAAHIIQQIRPLAIVANPIIAYLRRLQQHAQTS